MWDIIKIIIEIILAFILGALFGVFAVIGYAIAGDKNPPLSGAH